jgi:thymidylate synthase
VQITTIEARDLSEAFFKTCKACLEVGHEYKIDRGSFDGTRRKEFDFVTIHISNPGMRPLVPDVPQGIPCPTSMDYIDEYMEYLVTDTVRENEIYTYGQYIASQIPIVIERYKKEGFNTNQLTMPVGDEKSILQRDPPCLRLIDTRVRYGKLHFVVYFRSWDLWAGFPTNLGGIQLLKEYMASEIGVEDGELICCSKGLHLYEHCWELAKALVNR